MDPLPAVSRAEVTKLISSSTTLKKHNLTGWVGGTPY